MSLRKSSISTFTIVMTQNYIYNHPLFEFSPIKGEKIPVRNSISLKTLEKNSSPLVGEDYW